VSGSRHLLVRGGTIVTMDAGHRVLPGDVLVSDGELVAIGGDVQPPPGAEIVEAAGMVVLPGFVQGHVHLGQAMFRGLAEGRELMDWLRERIWPLEAAHDHDSVYWSSMLGVAECLSTGTTTINDIGLVHHADAIFEAIRDGGLRGIAGKCLMDVGVGVPPGLAERTDDALAEARALYDRWEGAEGGRIGTSICPRFILSCSERLWEGAVGLCRDLDLPMHTHLLEHPREEKEVFDALGESQMGFFDRLGVFDTDLRVAHGVWLESHHLDVLDGRHLTICHCPAANLKLGSGIADLAFLRGEETFDVGIGTDGAPCNNSMDLLAEMRLAALLQQYKQGPGRVSARDVLELATSGGARALGLEDTVGSLEVGKRGDLVVLDLERPCTFGPSPVSLYDRIVYTAARDAVHMVAVDGRICWRDGTWPHLDAEAIRRRPAEELERLLERARLS
jgi:5-methylthioadenosine/S-adenosylhomocysteine deaminase